MRPWKPEDEGEERRLVEVVIPISGKALFPLGLWLSEVTVDNLLRCRSCRIERKVEIQKFWFLVVCLFRCSFSNHHFGSLGSNAYVVVLLRGSKFQGFFLLTYYGNFMEPNKNGNARAAFILVTCGIVIIELIIPGDSLRC
ncbi:hypothetical protein NC651_024575 [Populus alba x Populus x berolinensis]|nr:hypothetical protein NC651_024575 [Populus alba x Populus x berolinensis]